MKKEYLYYTILFLFIVFQNCESINDLNGTTENSDFTENFGSSVLRSFLGKVIDVNGNPIVGAKITLEGNVQYSDPNGYFLFDESLVFEKFAYIKVEHEGYIQGSRSVVPTQNLNKVTIMLLDKNVAQTIDSEEAAEITLPSGASVALNGEYVTENGTIYSGLIDVIFHYLNATDELTALQMPGMLYAENNEGEEQFLKTLGMIAIELRGSNGEYLNLSENHLAQITIPVDEEILSSAPAQIPLWYFDESVGYWKEEGSAVLIGNTYIGEVQHFSFWNCDVPADSVTLNLNVTYVNNEPIANTRIELTSSEYGTTYGFTNDVGEVSGIIPKNETLTMNVIGNNGICENQSIYMESIGPYEEDSTLDITVQEDPNLAFENITGTILNCSGELIDNGYVIFKYSNLELAAEIENGIFNISLLRCSDNLEFIIMASDYDSLQSSEELSFTINSPNTDIGIISTCTDTEYIQYTINDEQDLLIAGGDYITARLIENQNELFLEIQGNNQQHCFYLYGNLNPNSLIGTYESAYGTNGNDYWIDIVNECFDIDTSTENTILYDLISIGEIGNYIKINYNGDYTDSSGEVNSIIGEIIVKRDF